MDGPQDLGGRSGFGAINPEQQEPIFHADWEKRALGLTLACGGLGHWTLDEGRHARESLSPVDYYSSSYYEIWIKALESLLLKHGEVTAEELKQGIKLQSGLRIERRIAAGDMPAVLAKGGPADRLIDKPARFAVGDTVKTITAHPSGHTRLPAYARDKIGQIHAVRGTHVFPDTNAHGNGEDPQWLYTVEFTGTELWGRDSEKGLRVSVDAWDSYLE